MFFSKCLLEHPVKRDKKTSQQNMSFDFIVRKHLQQAWEHIWPSKIFFYQLLIMVNNQRTSYLTINSYRKMYISIDTTEFITLHWNFNTDFFSSTSVYNTNYARQRTVFKMDGYSKATAIEIVDFSFVIYIDSLIPLIPS